MKTPHSSAVAVTLIPPHRSSLSTPVEARLWAKDAVRCRWAISSQGQNLSVREFGLVPDGTYTSVEALMPESGHMEFLFQFLDAEGEVLESRRAAYEVMASGVRSTRQIDGCWISIVHWSEDEARHFNTDLKKLDRDAWKEQIRAMNAAGIKSVLIQNVFDSDRYAGRNDLTVENYDGLALYPSPSYPRRYPLACDDPVSAILEAADECEMTVFLGVGLFAWFDFSAESLKWHKKVTQELFDLYGHHASLYGWYISEEMFGSLYDEWEHLPNEAYRDVVHFFQEYKAFAAALTPTKPVALAPNNIRFHEFGKEWGEILPHIDVIIPFAFARDPEHLNIAEIQAICDAAGTRFWVDMEMFAWPLDNGLVPKPLDELLAEIRSYDAVEQIFGYQFTGIMNLANSGFNLGGKAAEKLYADYCRRLAQQHSANEPLAADPVPVVA